MQHGFAPLRSDASVAHSAVVEAEQALFNGQHKIEIIPITWGWQRAHDSWWGPNWAFKFDDKVDGLDSRRADMETTFSGTGRRLVMMYNIAAKAPSDEGHKQWDYQPALDGELDAAWRNMAEDLVAMGMENTIIRPNPEHSHTWSNRYPRDANDVQLPQEEAGRVYADAFARCVSVMNSVAGADFDFLYSPAGRLSVPDNIAELGIPTRSDLWPSGERPPIMCKSHYDTVQDGGPGPEEWSTMTDAEKEAATLEKWEASDYPHMHSYTQLARDYGLRLGLTEWGVHTAGGSVFGGQPRGRGDNPWFMDLMMDYMIEEGFEFECVWSYYHNGGTNTIFWPPERFELPESRSAWVANVLADDGTAPPPDDEPPAIPTTPYLGLQLMERGTTGWGSILINNFTTIEQRLNAMYSAVGSGTTVSLTMPSGGSLGWHVPLNENITDIDVAISELGSTAGVSGVGGYTPPARGSDGWGPALNDIFSMIDEDIAAVEPNLPTDGGGDGGFELDEFAINPENASGQATFPPLVVGTDADAINGEFIFGGAGSESLDAPPENGRAIVAVNVVGGDYHLWLHGRPGRFHEGISGWEEKNQMWVLIDDTTYSWHTDDTAPGWRWEQAGVHEGSTVPSPEPVPVPLTLSPGDHTITFAVKEEGMELSHAILTNDLDFDPRGA